MLIPFHTFAQPFPKACPELRFAKAKALRRVVTCNKYPASYDYYYNFCVAANRPRQVLTISPHTLPQHDDDDNFLSKKGKKQGVANNILYATYGG